MKAVGRLFRLILLLMASLVILVVTLLGWIYFNPETTIELLRSRYFQNDPKISWSKLELSIDHLHGFNFQLLVKISDLTISKREPALDIQVPSLKADMILDLSHRKILISQLEVRSGDSHLTLSPPQPIASQEDKPEKNIFQWVQLALTPLQIFNQYIEIENFSIETGKFELYDSSGQLQIESNLQAKAVSLNHIVFQAHWSLPQPNGPIKFGLKGQLDLKNLGSSQPLLLADLQVKGFNLETETHITIVDANSEIRILTRGPLHYKTATLKLFSNPEVSLVVSDSLAEMRIHGNISGLPGLIPQVKNLKARISTPLKADQFWGPAPSQFLINSPIDLLFIKPQLHQTLEKSCECRFPLRQMFQANGQIWLANLLSQSSEKLPVLRSRISMESYENKLLEIALAATMDIDQRNGKLEFHPVLDSEVRIHKFRGLRPLFRAYKILIPAPAEVLDGNLFLEARGPVSQTSHGSRFPLNLKTDLTSEKQSVKTDIRADVLISRDISQIHFEAKAKIHALQLVLPPLDPAGGIPRVTPDRRIQKTPIKPKKSQGKFKMTFDLEVETPQEGGIRLLAEFFKPYVPLTLNLKSHGQKNMSGFLDVEPFQVVYLKRRVNVERIHLGLEPIGNTGLPVEGRLRVEQTLYTIYIDILGNTKNPVITLSSDPYLPESEIISVLLYDRTSDQLISADAETAGSVQAAIADRAIGLLGLWIFASTPIRSFHYNPVTQVYTATVVLAGDVTAGIGSDWESATHVELHKRISKRWLLTARWSSDSPNEPENSELVLQWERRF